MSTDDAGSEVAKRSEGKTGPQPALRASDAERDAMITGEADQRGLQGEREEALVEVRVSVRWEREQAKRAERARNRAQRAKLPEGDERVHRQQETRP